MASTGTHTRVALRLLLNSCGNKLQSLIQNAHLCPSVCPFKMLCSFEDRRLFFANIYHTNVHYSIGLTQSVGFQSYFKRHIYIDINKRKFLLLSIIFVTYFLSICQFMFFFCFPYFLSSVFCEFCLKLQTAPLLLDIIVLVLLKMSDQVRFPVLYLIQDY